jgi:urease accessory protein UreF
VANTANASLNAVGNAAILSDLVAMRHETAVPRIYRT